MTFHLPDPPGRDAVLTEIPKKKGKWDNYEKKRQQEVFGEPFPPLITDSVIC
jgi:hypothetical protein